MKLLLVGMGPGNGLSIAKRFGREGFEILMVARNETALQDFSIELATEGIKSSGYAVDITDDVAFAQLLKRVVQEHDDIEIAHYNASAYNPAKPSEIDLEVFNKDLKINIVGAILAVQAVLPQMKDRSRGAIFLTGGGTAINPPAFLASLGIGKAAIRNFTISLADECKDYGIHVATITISGMVKAGTRFDPDLIADEFWRLYQQPQAEWETEVMWA
jgi:NAD(P)-dependent dehydrogenase (short-subunit alcohol dehydrogenase family)